MVTITVPYLPETMWYLYNNFSDQNPKILTFRKNKNEFVTKFDVCRHESVGR